MYMKKVLNLGEIELIEYAGSDLKCVNSARASFGTKKDKLDFKDIKLLHRLIKDEHLSTLEHTLFTFRVKAPIFILRQWQRHRIASYNERSNRYCKPEFEFFTPDIDLERGIQNDVIDTINSINDICLEAYIDLLALGCKKEVARTILPQGLYSNMYFTCNLRSLLHFYKLRSSSHAQKEIQVYANAMMELVEEIPGNPFEYTLAFIRGKSILDIDFPIS
jgi:thymidylate synthase (FAD)